MVLNVGGTIHQVKWDTIDKFPNSRLQKLRYAASDCECSLTVSIMECEKLCVRKRISRNAFLSNVLSPCVWTIHIRSDGIL